VSRSKASFSRSVLILLLGRFIKVLTVKPSDVQDAMQRLDRLSSQEDKMVAVDTLSTVKHTNLYLMAMRRKSYRG